MLLAYSNKAFHWTRHSRDKMRFYRLSEARVRRVIHSPRRVEEGIAPDTVAMMQPTSFTGSGARTDWKQEIWVMAQKTRAHSDKTRKSENIFPRRSAPGPRKPAVIRIISVWRYPGKTKPRDEISKDFLSREYGSYLKSNG